MRGRAVSYVLLFIALFIWGFAYVVTKSGLSAVPPMLFALLRYVVAGVVLIVARTDATASSSSPLLGNALGVASVLSWGAYTILAKRMSDADPIAVTAVVSLIGTLMLVPAALIENASVSIASIPAEGWVPIIYLGALASAASYLLYMRALRDIDASLAGTYVNLSPVIGVVSGVIVLGERITTTAIVGGVMVLLGLWISSRNPRRA